MLMHPDLTQASWLESVHPMRKTRCLILKKNKEQRRCSMFNYHPLSSERYLPLISFGYTRQRSVDFRGVLPHIHRSQPLYALYACVGGFNSSKTLCILSINLLYYGHPRGWLIYYYQEREREKSPSLILLRWQQVDLPVAESRSVLYWQKKDSIYHSTWLFNSVSNSRRDITTSR